MALRTGSTAAEAAAAPLAAPFPAPLDAPLADVRLAGLGTAVPPHVLEQDVVEVIAGRILGPRFPDFQRLARTFTSSGVKTRYSVCPLEWFQTSQDWPERTARYLEGATALFVEAATNALAEAGLAAADVDVVVTVSSTGIATPTLEARAFGTMGFRHDILRVPVFGLGCAGGVSGLAIAQRLAAASPGSTVLLVCVETCTLAFRDDQLRKADIIATVLFGDGAAAAVLSSHMPGGPVNGTNGGNGTTGAPRLGAGVQHIWTDSLNIMGWDVDPTGFGVIFDRSIPPFVTGEFAGAVDFCLERMDLTREDITRYVCHPGGIKVLEAIEATMGLEAGALDHERGVIEDFGNMSAPTVLFVLDRFRRTGPRGRVLLTGLGPGFTASMIPLSFDG